MKSITPILVHKVKTNSFKWATALITLLGSFIRLLTHCPTQVNAPLGLGGLNYLFIDWIRDRWVRSPPIWSPSASESHPVHQQPSTRSCSLAAWGHQQYMSMRAQGGEDKDFTCRIYETQTHWTAWNYHVRSTAFQCMRLSPTIPLWDTITNLQGTSSRVVQRSFSYTMLKGKYTLDPLLYLIKGFKLHIQLLF